MDRIQAAGLAAVVGGVALIADLTFHLLDGLGQTYYVFAFLMGLCLAGAPAGLWLAGAITRRWRTTAITGTAIIVVGIVAWLAAFALLFVEPDLAFSQKLTPGGSVLMAIGMLVLGVAVLRSRALDGWRAWTPLAVGIYFPLQLIAQILFFLEGRDDELGPNGVLLGLWGALWALVGIAVLTTARRHPDVGSPLSRSAQQPVRTGR